jgi:hypothetical protein
MMVVMAMPIEWHTLYRAVADQIDGAEPSVNLLIEHPSPRGALEVGKENHTCKRGERMERETGRELWILSKESSSDCSIVRLSTRDTSNFTLRVVPIEQRGTRAQHREDVLKIYDTRLTCRSSSKHKNESEGWISTIVIISQTIVMDPQSE